MGRGGYTYAWKDEPFDLWLSMDIPLNPLISKPSTKLPTLKVE